MVVITNCGAIVSDRLAVAVCCGLPESLTVTPMVAVPAAAGVPVIAPLDGFMERPEGKLVADQVKLPAPPLAANGAE